MSAIKKIANFSITGHLGKGGMGDVYKAVQEPLGRIVALKVLFNRAGDEKAVKRFETEARAISKLQHNNIVALFDYGIEDGLNYFAMQHIDGQDLNSLLKKKKQLPFDQIIDISKQICRGLLYAHESGIIHRDIKPHNILIDKSGNAFISDFGIARIFKESGITHTGITIGTPEYMSPEQAEGKDLTPQTDIYSLGTLMYEMVAGTPPFTGNNAVAVAYKQVHELPKPSSLHRADVPKRLDLIILKALKKSKNDRYKLISSILRDLDTVKLDDKSTLFVKKTKTAEIAAADERITDRRNSSSRDNGTVAFNPFSINFWLHTIKSQWLSLILIAILYYFQFYAK